MADRTEPAHPQQRLDVSRVLEFQGTVVKVAELTRRFEAGAELAAARADDHRPSDEDSRLLFVVSPSGMLRIATARDRTEPTARDTAIWLVGASGSLGHLTTRQRENDQSVDTGRVHSRAGVSGGSRQR